MADIECRKCKQEMELMEEKMLRGTKYRILKCSNCKSQVARADN